MTISFSCYFVISDFAASAAVGDHETSSDLREQMQSTNRNKDIVNDVHETTSRRVIVFLSASKLLIYFIPCHLRL